jgi:hypothetical protein
MIIIFYNHHQLDHLHYYHHFFIDKWFEERIKISPTDQIISRHSENELDFFYRIFFRLRRSNFIIIEPDASKIILALCSILLLNKYSIVVHNANYWLKPIYKFSIKRILIITLNKILLNNSKSLIVVNRNVKKYISHISNHKTYYFPFNLSIQPVQYKYSNLKEQLFIVVPGNLSSRRRDYETVLLGFIDAVKKREDLILVLLGKIERFENKLLKLIEQVKSKFPNNILYWSNFIKDTEYDFYINSANYFIAPLNKYLYTDISVEEYGITKETINGLIKNDRYKVLSQKEFDNIQTMRKEIWLSSTRTANKKNNTGKSRPDHSTALKGRKKPEFGIRMSGAGNPMFGKVHPNKGKAMPQISAKLKGKAKK